MIGYYRNGTLQEAGSLAEAAGLGAAPAVSVVGAGGKTSLLCRLAQEYAKAGQQAVVTTTTHILKEDRPYFLADPSPDQIRKCLEAYGQAWAGGSSPGGRLKGLPEEDLKQIFGWGIPVLIEADGAKRMPLKVPADHEPVILPQTTHVLSVYGLDAVGRPLEEVCFRQKEAEALLEKRGTEQVTPEDIAFLAASERGGRKGCPPGALYTVVLNKADTPDRRKAALAICGMLEERGAGRVLVTSCPAGR